MSLKVPRLLLLSYFFIVSCMPSVSQTIDAGKYIQEKDATPGIIEAVRLCRQKKASRLSIPKGTYNFYPDYAIEKCVYISNNDGGIKRIAFDLSDLSNLEIDGNGSRFIFHGFISPFLLENTRNVTLKNLSIDYARTFHSEGKILAVYGDSIDVRFSQAYPYKIDHSVLTFIDERKNEYPWMSLLEFDPVKRETAYKAVDYWCGPHVRVKELSQGVIRVYYPGIRATVGNVMVFGAAHRLVPAFILSRCSNISFSGIDIYHCGGMGIVAQMSRDISIDHVNVTPAPQSGRVVSLTADATHFANCSGYIRITDCLFENQKDDATNIHGLYAQIDSVLSVKELLVKLVHPQQHGVRFIVPNQKIEFVDAQSLETYAQNEVRTVEYINKEYMKVTVKQPLSKEVKLKDGIASITDQPDVLISNCRMRGNRARGFLLGSRGKIVIENNYFHIPGAAILFEGDCRYWFEQAGVRDIVIRKNIFDNCFYGTWGNAVIQVASGIEQDKRSQSRYNRNLQITENTFRTFCPEILNLYSVDGLVFKQNKIEETHEYPCPDKSGKRYDIQDSSDISISE